MAMRKIKDAKDLTTNELIYFKGHAKATYMSNGKTVEDAINQVGAGGGGETNTMVSTSWGRLVSACDSGELIPGTYYRIIDYVTTTTQEETTSAGNLFDVIVLALDEHTLSEEAYAIQSERDTDGYFGNSNLSAWKLWYCLLNDTSRFAWADEENGRGVIYRMIDEFDNDCPYDFKNILFTRYELEAPDEYFTDDIGSKWLEQYATNVRGMFDIKAPSFVWAGLQLGEYYWEEEYGEIFSQATSERKMFYTFSDITDFENKEITSDASLTSSTYNNKIGYSKDDFNMYLPNNVFFGKDCRDNSFGNNCINNSIGNRSFNNTFGENCYNNTFGEDCYNNKLYNNCSSIIFNNDCCKNVFGLTSYSNSLGEMCQSNVFGQESYGNSFGVSCSNNIFGNAFGCNSFFMWCCYNSFGNNCWTNILSNDCIFNNFGNDCIGNRFGMGYFYKHNTFGEGVQYLHLTNDEQWNYDNCVQNYRIANGTQGIWEEPLEINAERGRNYETTIAMNSNGDIIEFCEADSNNNSVFYTTDNQFQRIDPNKVYVIINPISALRVDEYGIYGTTKIHEYKIHFVTSNNVEKLELPTETIWANGEIPSLEPNTYYELSVVNTPIGNNSYFKAILTSFK